MDIGWGGMNLGSARLSETGITFVIQPVVRIITKPTTGEAIKKHRLEKVAHLREIDVSICYTFF